jgi:hypothetical protein
LRFLRLGCINVSKQRLRQLMMMKNDYIISWDQYFQLGSDWRSVYNYGLFVWYLIKDYGLNPPIKHAASIICRVETDLYIYRRASPNNQDCRLKSGAFFRA